MDPRHRKDVVADLDETAPEAAPAVVLEEGGTAAANVVLEDGDPDGALPKGAVLNPDRSVTLTLRFPVTLTIRSGSGQERQEIFDKLVFHRLSGADMRAISAASRESSAVIAFARSTRKRETIMNALFDRMDGADIEAAGTVIEHFFGSGRKTGR